MIGALLALCLLSGLVLLVLGLADRTGAARSPHGRVSFGGVDGRRASSRRDSWPPLSPQASLAWEWGGY